MIIVTISGNISTDIKYVEGTNGGERAEFNIASSDGVRDKDGNYTTSFIRCVAFSPYVLNYIKKYAVKGTKIVASGKLRLSSTQNQDGSYNNFTQAIIDSVELVNNKDENEQSSGNTQQTTQPKQQKQNKDDYYAASEKIIDPSSDLPF